VHNGWQIAEGGEYEVTMFQVNIRIKARSFKTVFHPADRNG
jgi:hypothetical protein